MSDRTRVETDPSVCYRHPGRQSWVLCQRCGRTVCPECQIQAPVGVHCPECVAETSGGVAWRPTNVAPLKPKRRKAARTARRAGSLLVPVGGLDLAKLFLGVALALYLVGFAGNLPYTWLAALPGTGLQVWRFLTAPFASIASPSLGSLLSIALPAIFFYLTAPQIERMVGRNRFLAVFAASSVVGAASAVLSGGEASGLTLPLFGCFAALLVLVWDDPQARTQILVMIGINLLLNIALGGGSRLPLLLGAMIGGAGVLYLLRVGPQKGWKPRTPAVIAVAVCAGLVLLAVGRGLAF